MRHGREEPSPDAIALKLGSPQGVVEQVYPQCEQGGDGSHEKCEEDDCAVEGSQDLFKGLEEDKEGCRAYQDLEGREERGEKDLKKEQEDERELPESGMPWADAQVLIILPRERGEDAKDGERDCGLLEEHGIIFIELHGFLRRKMQEALIKSLVE